MLEQKIVIDLGIHISFENGLSLQVNYSELVEIDLPILTNSNNFQLYFEVEDINSWYEKINGID